MFIFVAHRSHLAFRRGDIIIMDENCSGETLNTTGWASGTNDRTKQWGNFAANYVYIVPVVYVQTSPKPVANKPAPHLFRPPSPEEPVSNTLYYLKLETFLSFVVGVRKHDFCLGT